MPIRETERETERQRQREIENFRTQSQCYLPNRQFLLCYMVISTNTKQTNAIACQCAVSEELKLVHFFHEHTTLILCKHAYKTVTVK